MSNFIVLAMSVWTSDSQLVDLFKDIFIISEKVADRLLPGRPDIYLGCSQAIVPSGVGDSWLDLADVAGWPGSGDHGEEEDAILQHMSDCERLHYGLSGVYTLVRHVMRGHFRCRPAFDRSAIDAVVSEFITLVTPSTQITPRRFVERAHQLVTDAEELSWAFEDAAEAFKHCRVLFGKPDGLTREVVHEKYLGGPVKSFVGVVRGNLLFMAGRGRYQQLGLILSRQNLDYLIGALTRLGNLVEYYQRHYKGPDYHIAMEYLKLTVNSAGCAAGPNAKNVARTFHKVRTIFQMQTLESVFDDAVNGEIRDYTKDGLDAVVTLPVALEVLSRLPVLKALEVTHTYKWMPPPDYDATSIPAKVQHYHMSHRSSGLDVGADPHQRQLYRRIQTERKINLASAYRRRHGEWPAGLAPRGGFVTPQEADAWDPIAIELYHQMGTDIVGQVKDKTIVSASMDHEALGNKTPTDKSYLLWYMSAAGLFDTVSALRDPSSWVEDSYVRSAYKPEAHKPDSRLFYMAPPRQRTLLGELEGNLANFARYYPGSLMGKDTGDKARIISEIMDLNVDCPGVPVHIPTTAYVVTFDLAKFSPRSSPAVTKEYHEFWARVYGTPAITNLYNIGCTGKILHTTAGIKHVYTNPGCDLEGFRGKMMTMFHSDMLAAAVRLARERGHLAGRSQLAAFIDDGSLKVAVVGEGNEARENAAAFLGDMQEIYAAAGQDNNPSKTVVSTVGGEILAQLYYKGLLVPQGVKALMRLAPDYENATSTFPEEMDQLYATAQGAVKDGANWVVAYRMMVAAIVKCVFRWVRGASTVMTPHQLAMKMVTPKSFGGLGVSSLQALVTNAAVNQTVEGAGMLNRIARMYPEHSNEVYSIISKGVVRRDPLSILRDPLRVRLAVPVLIENRLTMEVVHWLEANAGEYTRFLAAYKSERLLDHATRVAESLLQSGVISVPLFERAWKSTPLAFVESVVGKFKRSATIISLLGYRMVMRLRAKNMSDLKNILNI